MIVMPRRSLANALVLTLATLGVAAGPTWAQSGRADLRYVAPLPATVIY